MTAAPAILGVGLATPPTRNQRELAELAIDVIRPDENGAERIRKLHQRVEIDTRGIAVACDDRNLEQFRSAPRDRGPTTAERLRVYERAAPPLARDAAARALREARLGPHEITHLVTVSCTGFGAPGVDRALIDALGLSAGVERTHVGFMGCHGMLNALRIAGAIAGADPAQRILVVAVEICSAHLSYQPSDEKRLIGALFADGAGAAVVGCSEGGAHRTLRATAAHVIPDSETDMTWRIGDHGFEMTLSRRVPGLIREQLAPWLTSWLARNELSAEDVSRWAIHPGGPRILDAALDALGLPPEAADASRAVLREHGNMSSPTILFILERLGRAAGPTALLAFGPGLTVEAALLG